MKIGHQNDASVNITSNNQSAAAKTGAEVANAARSERKAPSASVMVSATLARGLEKASSTEPEVDDMKVNAMKQAIADKSYTVNASAIADKLLASTKELSQRTIS